jgi:WD40 repeat protein
VKIDLTRIELPDEHEARERAWHVVSRAYLEHEPRRVVRSRRRPLILAVAAAAVGALIAVAVSPAGSSLVHSVREAVGISKAAPALTRLPTGGQLLVSSGEGPWIVQPDGSKRLLGRYQQASWSPHGLFVAVTHKHELLAVDPRGTVHWSLARPGTISLPRWSPDGYRIAYLDGSTLRVVAGDGTGDHRFAVTVAHVAPAWQPNGHNRHIFAFVTSTKTLYISNADTNELVARHRLTGIPFALFWTTDAKRLVAVAAHRITVFDARGRRLGTIPLNRNVVSAAIAPSRHRVAVVFAGAIAYAGIRSEIRSFDLDRLKTPSTDLFSGTGTFSSVAFSPDAHWLLVAWPTADQWVFVRTGGAERVTAVASISSQFEPGRRRASFPALDGWCCAP